MKNVANPERLFSRVECGAQFSLALSASGLVWTWGKGDYFRLGHASDSHVRRPQVIEGLRKWKIVDVAVGALHCLAVTDTGEVQLSLDYILVCFILYG